MAISNASGNAAAVYTMEAFGKVLQCGTSTGYLSGQVDPQPYHLTTKEYDPHAHLYYFNARWYDPTTGRFLSQDRVRGPGNNRYAFCWDNPAKCVDTNGLYPALVGPGAKGLLHDDDPDMGPLLLDVPRAGAPAGLAMLYPRWMFPSQPPPMTPLPPKADAAMVRAKPTGFFCFQHTRVENFIPCCIKRDKVCELGFQLGYWSIDEGVPGWVSLVENAQKALVLCCDEWTWAERAYRGQVFTWR